MATSLLRVPYNVDDYPRRDGFIILCGNLDDAPSLYEVLNDTVPENKPVGQIDPPAQRLYSNVITNELGVDNGQISVEFSVSQVFLIGLSSIDDFSSGPNMVHAPNNTLLSGLE